MNQASRSPTSNKRKESSSKPIDESGYHQDQSNSSDKSFDMLKCEDQLNLDSTQKPMRDTCTYNTSKRGEEDTVCNGPDNKTDHGSLERSILKKNLVIGKTDSNY